MTVERDELAEYHYDETEQPPDNLRTIRCLICGQWYETLQRLSVHQVVHQRRACRYCGGPYSANAVSHHEKFCPAKIVDADRDDCDGWDLPAFAATTWFQGMCAFLQSSKFMPESDGRHVLIVPSGGDPKWVRASAIGSFISANQIERPVCVIPTATIRRAAAHR